MLERDIIELALQDSDYKNADATTLAAMIAEFILGWRLSEEAGV